MTTTSAPASCTSCATPAPMPVAPPTTTARLPSYRYASKSDIRSPWKGPRIGTTPSCSTRGHDGRQVGGGEDARRRRTHVRHRVDGPVRRERRRERAEVVDGHREV